jgi:hypothetical protein
MGLDHTHLLSTADSCQQSTNASATATTTGVAEIGTAAAFVHPTSEEIRRRATGTLPDDDPDSDGRRGGGGVRVGCRWCPPYGAWRGRTGLEGGSDTRGFAVYM